MAKQGIKDYFITGIFAVLPLALTVTVALWVVSLLWDKFFSLLVPGCDRILNLVFTPEMAHELESYHVHQILGFVLLLAIIVAIGFVARRLIGLSLLKLLDQVISAIPGLNFIYGTIRQFTSTMDPDSPQRDAFRHAVLIQVNGAQMLGFLTSRSRIKGKPYATVFVPCNQLIQGYNLMVPEKSVTHLDMNVDDALKYVISFGMVAPLAFLPRKATKAQK